MPEKPLDFRAPPPSPIASGRRSCFANDEVLSEFLEHSLRVPDLILPDKVFPKQKFIENPPVIDFQSLDSLEIDSIFNALDSIATIGCFQLVNYGIPSEIMRSAAEAAAGIFELAPEKRAGVTRSPDNLYGFEEVQGEEESELSEEFVWCRDRRLKLEMEGIWPGGHSNFSEKLESLMLGMEKIVKRILKILQENSIIKQMYRTSTRSGDEHDESVCYVYKHRGNIPADRWESSLKYDVIRMLIRGVDFSHALCLHICDKASEFHVYSKKGWVSFSPKKDAVLVTIGDQIQEMSGGQYKQVIGRAIYRDEKEDCISMAFLYSSPKISVNNNYSLEKEKTISLTQQIVIFIISTLVYQFLVYIYKKL